MTTQIRFQLPQCESFDYVVALVRATGARGEGMRRFVIDSPMSLDQVWALLQLKESRSLWDRGQRLEIEIDPDPDIPDEYVLNAYQWWAEANVTHDATPTARAPSGGGS